MIRNIKRHVLRASVFASFLIVATLIGCSGDSQPTARQAFNNMKMYHASRILETIDELEVPERSIHEQMLDINVFPGADVPLEAKMSLDAVQRIDASSDMIETDGSFELKAQGTYGSPPPPVDAQSMNGVTFGATSADRRADDSAAVDGFRRAAAAQPGNATLFSPESSRMQFDALLKINAALVNDAFFAQVEHATLSVEGLIDYRAEDPLLTTWYRATIDEINEIINEELPEGQRVDIRRFITNPVVEYEKMQEDIKKLLPELRMWNVEGFAEKQIEGEYRIVVTADKVKMLKTSDAIIDFITERQMRNAGLDDDQKQELERATQRMKDEARAWIENDLVDLRGTISIASDDFRFTGFRGTLETAGDEGSMDLHIILKDDVTLMKATQSGAEEFIAFERSGESFQMISNEETFFKGTIVDDTVDVDLYEENKPVANASLNVKAFDARSVNVTGTVTLTDEPYVITIDALKFERMNESSDWSVSVRLVVLSDDRRVATLTYDVSQRAVEDLNIEPPENFESYTKAIEVFSEQMSNFVGSMDSPSAVSPVPSGADSMYFDPNMDMPPPPPTPQSLTDEEIDALMQDMTPEEREVMKRFMES